ncbi:hypothetical protein [Micromonospora carbonacea]|uniref:Uncharacterized protein n=1 Tax=Micromonospora carbonacea TaxID=47853 RepID=A0A1C5AA62_9ACTN|nr:hypothetical protein [Micromonospora carbonacea]SCF42039.1 hypothetical protein GA0070563_11230 [Micromonospora carbonacea]
MTAPEPVPAHRRLHVVVMAEYGKVDDLFAYDNRDDAQRAVDAGHGNDILELVLVPAGILPVKVRVYTAGPDQRGELSLYDDEKYPWQSPGPIRALDGTAGWFVHGEDHDAVVAEAERRIAARRVGRAEDQQ